MHRIARIAGCGLVGAWLWLAASEAHAGLRAEPVASGLTVPVFATAPFDDPRLFVVELAGSIRIVRDGVVLPTPFLDISTRVSTAGAGGLRGLAFDPDFEINGLFYVYYTSSSAQEIVVSRFATTSDPDVADDTSEEVLYAIPNPAYGHNGGTIAFSPIDGYLYVMPGDGGFGVYDPPENAQNPLVALGKVLRFDVSGGAGTPALPAPGNPFIGNPAGLDEIWSLGLRNPWRSSFDRDNGDLWLTDVGQEEREEINRLPHGHAPGANYGWDVFEGSLCNPIDPSTAFPCGAPPPEIVFPIFEYGHDDDPDCSGSITGGYVHRGAIPEMQGLYFFGDFCTGQFWSLDPDGVVVTERTGELSPGGGVHDVLVSFAEDGYGFLYFVHISGDLYRIESDAPDGDGDAVPDTADNCPVDPNPGQHDADDDGIGDACDAVCDNGLDDDGDGRADFDPVTAADPDFLAGSGDPVCRTPNWTREHSACQDGIDNDGQKGTDFDGGESILGVGNGDPDGADPSCVGAPWTRAEKPRCGTGAGLVLVLAALLMWRRRSRG